MIQQFIHYIRTMKGYSENTCIAYEKDLRDFVGWAKVHLDDARWSTITREVIDQYITSLVADELKPATTNRRLSAISGLFRFMKREGYKVEDPTKFESRRKNIRNVPNTIPISELQSAYNNSLGVTKILIGLLMSTGIRIQELLDMTFEDINFETSSIKIHGKGMKERLVYSRPEILQPLKEIRDGAHLSGLIFNLDQRTARRMIWEALKKTCHAPQLSPHAIRHTFATAMANNGVNGSTIAAVLGHNNISTTQKYIDIRQADSRRACQEYALFN